jgi:propanol-preferring alcohol dehydrogenase
MASRPLALEELPDPTPGPGEIVIDVSCCGVCHTDLHTVEGDLELPRLPLVPGHQVVGRVGARGPGADRFRNGERVGVAWLHDACGGCAQCLAGSENLCPDARFTGLHHHGGYAERAVVHEAFAYRLPEAADDLAVAPLLCAGIIGYRALTLSKAGRGDTLGLVGFGASAHVTAQVARHLGMKVFAFSRSEEHRAHALSLGAAWAGGLDDEPPEPCRSIVNFTPAGGTVPGCLERLARGGTLVLAGITMSSVPALDYERHLYWEREVKSVANATRKDGEALIELAAEIPIRTTVETHPLAGANEALLRVAEGAVTGAAVLEVRGGS